MGDPAAGRDGQIGNQKIPIVLIERNQKGEITVSSQFLSLEGIERELLAALTIIARKLDMQAMAAVLRAEPRVLPAPGWPPGVG